MPVLFVPVVPGRVGTFPDGPLGAEFELLLGDTWTPITGYVAQPVTITRGRSDGQQQASPDTAPMQWSNIDGRFSPRNPRSPYYGLLGRNTPVRISIPASGTYLRMGNDDVSYCSTPSSTGLSASGDLDIRFDMELEDYSQTVLISKWWGAIGLDSWELHLNSDGTITFIWTSASGVNNTATSTVSIPPGRVAVRATLTIANGTVTFYTAPAIGGSWTQLGDVTIVGTTTVAATTTPVRIGIGSPAFGSLQGAVYAASIAIGGSQKAFPIFSSATAGAATLTDAQGNVWSLGGTAEFSNRLYRFAGECAALPQTWERDEVWTQVSTAGILRRMNQNSAPLDSPLKRGYLRITGATTPVIYWPCEDGSKAETLAAAIGGNDMTINGSANLASDSNFAASGPIPGLNGSKWTGSVPNYTPGPDIVVRFLLDVDAGGDTDSSRIMRVYTNGTVATFSMIYHTGGALSIAGYDSAGNQLFVSPTLAFGVNGTQFRMSMELRQSGGNINYSLASLSPGAHNGNGWAGSIAGNIGHVRQIMVNPDGGLMSTSVGHISLQSTWESLYDLATGLNAYQGETAGNRFLRLCNEEDVAARVFGPPDSTVLMGAQSVDTLFNLLQECESADGGMIYELLDTPGLGYRTYGSLCAQPASVALDYSLDHLSSPLSPTDDDAYTQNDITVSKPSGSSARAVLDDGSTMSISAPPVGVGSYVNSFTANVLADSQLGDQANWRLHLGTVNEERYPSMVVDLTYRALLSKFYDVMDVRLGDMVQVSNLPTFLPPDNLRAIVWGQTEVIGDFALNTTWQTQPASPYDVLVAGPTGSGSGYSDIYTDIYTGGQSYCYADTSGSSLGVGIDNTATSLTVITASGNQRWTTDSADLPFDIAIGGERITVVNITGTGLSQTFSVRRSVNGVVKSHSAGESVSLFSPVFAALA